ncbi:hypothetical protein PMAYCL1PPCAC_20607, partial [Pristionchus mayeri]
AVPEKKTYDNHKGSNKLLIDLVSGGTVATIAKTALGGNLASVARYAPSQALNFAFKEKYKNYYLEGVDKNERFWKFFWGNLQSGGAAGATALCIVHPLEHALTRASMSNVRNPRARGNREGFVGRLIKTTTSRAMFRGLFCSLPGTAVNRALYFGLYDTLKVKMASGDLKLDFFSALALALVTTASSNFLSHPYYILGQVFMKKPEHMEFYSTFNNNVEKRVKILRKEGWRANYHKEVFRDCLQILDYTVRAVNKEGFSKRFALRSATGALVLVGYDEIQKWLH